MPMFLQAKHVGVVVESFLAQMVPLSLLIQCLFRLSSLLSTNTIELQSVLFKLRSTIPLYSHTHTHTHTILGQFWNVPIQVANFNGPVESSDVLDLEDRYSITVSHPDAERERMFTAILYDFNWEFARQPCFYAGNQQGGPIAEVMDPNDSVIEGEYFDYQTEELFATGYKFTRFEENQC